MSLKTKTNRKKYKKTEKKEEKRKNTILTITLTLLFLIILSLNTQASFNVAYETINNKISHSETASFYIILENTGETNETIRMFFEDIKWNFRTEPLNYYFSGITLKPKEKKVFQIYLKPSTTLPYNTYLLNLNFYSENTNERKTITLPVRIKLPGTEIGEYLTAVSKFVEVPIQVDPRKKIPVKINLRNRNPKNIKNFTIILSSKYFYKTLHTNLKPLEKKNNNTKYNFTKKFNTTKNRF